MVGGLPSGTVTFLFTDVEGSTRLWEEYPAEMAVALARHDEVLRRVVEGRGGYVFTTAGDSFAVSFARGADAVGAAVEAQRRLGEVGWPGPLELRVRMGLHSGEAFEREGDYFGSAVSRAARLMSAAHGGQIVVSAATRDIVADGDAGEVGFVDLGVHRLKDLSADQAVFQVAAEGLEASFPPLATLDAVDNNLPVVLDEVLGRDEAIGELSALVEQRRLATVVGVGGIGKTRLTMQVAASVADRFADGAWWCELAPVGDPDAVANAVAQAMGVRQHPGQSMVDSIAEYCRRRHLLVVLDNCEHVLDAAAELVERLLAVAPDVTVMANSREALGVSGEYIFALGPLAVGDAEIGNGGESPAVALFLERAAAASRSAGWVEGEVEAARRVCRRLDGVPLAIELAASRARSLTVADIELRLDDAFRLLRGGRRGVERHRTLAATIDWSYEPLDDASRSLFDRLAVFAGGWELTAAAAVCADGDVVDELEVFDLLDGLVAKSLVAVDTTGTSARYRLLEPLRQYAEDRLAERGDVDTYHRRHVAYFTSWAEDWSARVYTDEQAWAPTMRTEWPNLRAAVTWAIDDGDVDHSARLVAAAGTALTSLLEHEVGAWALRVLDLVGIGEHPLGPDMAGVGAASAWWLGRLDTMADCVARGEQMPTYQPTRREPTNMRAQMLFLDGDVMAARELRAQIEPTDLRERVLHASVHGREMALLSAHTDLARAQKCLDTLNADAAATGSNSIRSMAKELEAWISSTRGDFAAAVELCRESIAAAEQAGSSYLAHINALNLGFSAALSQDLRPDDLEFFARTLREQRNAGQQTDLWLTLGGLVLALHEAGRTPLARDIHLGLQTSPWQETLAPVVADLLGDHTQHDDHAQPPELEDLVDRTLAELDHMAEEREQAQAHGSEPPPGATTNPTIP